MGFLWLKTSNRGTRRTHRKNLKPNTNRYKESRRRRYSKLKLDPLLGVNSGVKRMLDFLHFRDEISGLYKSLRRIPSGQDQVQVRLFFLNTSYLFKNLVHVEKLVIQSVYK